jgi:hypothetical protein
MGSASNSGERDRVIVARIVRRVRLGSLPRLGGLPDSRHVGWRRLAQYSTRWRAMSLAVLARPRRSGHLLCQTDCNPDHLPRQTPGRREPGDPYAVYWECPHQRQSFACGVRRTESQFGQRLMSALISFSRRTRATTSSKNAVKPELGSGGFHSGSSSPARRRSARSRDQSRNACFRQSRSAAIRSCSEAVSRG